MSAPGDLIQPFLATLPQSYRDRWGIEASRAHASLALDGEGALARVGIVQLEGEGEPTLCVVTRDRPGLLAMISEALMRHQLDVVDAEAYTRHIEGQPPQALDLFWVRHIDGEGRSRSASAEDAAAVERTLLEVLATERQNRAQAPTRLPTPRVEGSAEARAVVRFLEDDEGGLTTLEVETNDRAGLLLALSEALFGEGVQIVRSEVRTRAGEVSDRFVISELDGTAIGAERRLAVQVAVLTAIDPASWRTDAEPS